MKNSSLVLVLQIYKAEIRQLKQKIPDQLLEVISQYKLLC